MSPSAESGSPYENITEMTLLTPIKDGEADELAQVLAAVQIAEDSPIKKISTIHYARWVILDEGARLLFTSNFDGTWEKYLRDFSEKIPEGLDAIWGHCVGWPGAQPFAPFRKWVDRHQVPANLFYAAYPESTVREVQRALDWKEKTERFVAELAKPPRSS